MCSANRLKRLQSLFMGRTSVCLTVVSALLHHRNVICLDTFPRECSPPPPPTTPFSQPHDLKGEAGGIDVFVSGTPPQKNKKRKKHSVCTWCVFLSSAVLLVKRVLTRLSTLAHKQTQAGYWDSKYANIWRDLHRDQRTKLCCNDYIGIKTKLSINTLYRIKAVFCHKHNRNILQTTMIEANRE